MRKGLQPLAGAAHSFDCAQTFDVQRDIVPDVRRLPGEADPNQET
jgi:hypothetical protein